MTRRKYMFYDAYGLPGIYH